MSKALLIAAGTVTGLGAVLSITPPALSDSVGTLELSGATMLPTTATPTASATAAAPTATPTKSATTPAQPTTQPTTKPTVAATPTKTVAATGFSGTVNGTSFSARSYGTVSVSATFVDGKIKSVSASQNPTSWSQQSLTILIPYVNNGSITVEQVKSYSAAELPCTRSNSCNSRASYTAEAFWSSLKSAITKAGL
jgi:hypothetical protein